MNTGGRRNTGPSSLMRPSTSVGHLSSFGDGGYSPPGHTMAYDDDDGGGAGSVHGKKIKRTKSMWKFKKTGGADEVLAGMSMWKHRSLVDVNAAEEDEQQQLQNGSYNNKSSTGTPVANKKFTITCRDIDIAGNGGGFAAADDDDSQTIMNGGSSTVRRMTYDNRKPQQQQQQHHPQQTHRGHDRTSRRSSSSSFGGEDSESCIVVDDHLKDARTPPAHTVQSGPPASLLPRTRLIKQTGGGGSGGAVAPVTATGGGLQNGTVQQQQHMLLPPPPPPAVRTATGNDGYQHDSDVDVRFESSKLQTFKYINANNNDGWYDSWGEKRKK